MSIRVVCTSLFVGVMMVLSSCSTTRYVPEDELLLNSVKVRTDGEYRDVNTANLRGYVRQKPNSKWFAAFKLPLYTYSLSGRDTTRWINRTLRNMGEAPVLYDSLKMQQTLADLRQQLHNEGFLQADVTAETTVHGKKIDVTYWLQPGEPYFVHDIYYDIDAD